MQRRRSRLRLTGRRRLQLRARLHRLISVMKMRGGGTDSSLREFSISDKGITIAPTFDSAEAILSGLAYQRPDAPTPARRSANRKRRPTRRG